MSLPSIGDAAAYDLPLVINGVGDVEVGEVGTGGQDGVEVDQAAVVVQ
jgi:hypothetical protein